MSDDLRIRPVDPDAAEGPLKDMVERNRKKWGQPLIPYLMYGRSPAVLKGTMAMWAATLSFDKIDRRLQKLVNRRVAWWNGCPF